MAIVKMYDKEGKIHMMEEVDAREAENLNGYTRTPPKGVKEEDAEYAINSGAPLNPDGTPAVNQDPTEAKRKGKLHPEAKVSNNPEAIPSPENIEDEDNKHHDKKKK